jgi:protein ImuB
MAHEQRSRHDLPTASTVLEVALAEPSRDGTHLLALLRERLVQLPAPTMELRLQAVDIARRASPNAELFPTPASEHEGLTRLIERLQARLGREQVQRLEPRPDHRPERATAWRTADARQSPRPGRAMAAAAGSAVLPPEGQAPARPVWLLQRPVPLPDSAHGPRLDGQPLQLLSGPERIESGWWDAERVERDYFIAQLPEGALVWIYRERVPVGCAGLGWFLQGRFG